MSSSINERISGAFARIAPQAVWSRVLLLACDVAIFNFVFYHVLRSVLLEPLGFATALGTVAWLLILVVVLFIFHGLRLRRGPVRLTRVVLEIGLFGAVCAFVAFAASLATTDKGVDRSWLRVEMIKTPLWFAMYAKTCPGFTGVLVAVTILFAWRSVASPRSWWVRVAPAIAMAGFVAIILKTFFEDGTFHHLIVFFSAPIILFWILLDSGASVLAFRMLPLVWHTLLISLTYIGFIPVTRLAPQFVDNWTAHGLPQPNRFGVTRLFPPGTGSPGPTFAFLRKMVLSGERAFVSYGPTCGVYSVQRETGALRRLPMHGPLRDIDWSTDGRNLWATNHERGDFLSIEPETLQTICSIDLFHEAGMKVPWGFVVDHLSGHVYMANVTPPIVAELTVHMERGNCGIRVDREINFHSIGYTRFTDGAFDLHIDHERNRLYVMVGMLEGKYEMGLVEMELSSFTVLRDLRLPAGPTLVAVRGRDTALLPSYYRDPIYEVSLADMRIVRTIPAAPTIMAIEQDEKRGLFYATSRTTGELLVIDYARGEVVRSFAVGAKPDALKLDAATDQLFLGSARGLFRIDLARFWSSLEPR